MCEILLLLLNRVVVMQMVAHSPEAHYLRCCIQCNSFYGDQNSNNERLAVCDAKQSK